MGFVQLAGILVQALLLAAVIAYPLAWLLLSRYTAVVDEFMKGSRPSATTLPTCQATTSTLRPAYRGSAPQLHRELVASPWRAARVQACAAVFVAVAMAILLLSSLGGSVGAMSVATLTVPLTWPGTVAAVLTAGMTKRQRTAIVLVGALIYIGLGMAAMRSGSTTALAGLALLWILPVLSTVYLAPFFTRRMRAAGPLILFVTIFPAIGAVAALPLAGLFPFATWRAILWLSAQGVPASLAMPIYLALVALLFLAIGILLLNAIARAYAQHRLGDDTIALSAVWLTFILFFSGVYLIQSGPQQFVLGLCGYPLYLGAVAVGNRTLRHTHSDSAPTLLLLRVFADDGPTENLFHVISRYWRHIGAMTMIVGHDLASATISPDEILKYWRGDTADLFMTAACRELPALLPLRPRRDPDGRFRVEKRYCAEGVWQEVALAMIETSSVILVDLRQLGRDGKIHPGIVFEVQALVQTGAISRAVLLRDHSETGDQALTKLGVDISSGSVLRLTGDVASDTSLVLDHLAKRCERVDPGE
jgi:hypothetical protein